MADLGTPSQTIEILQKHHFHLQKKYGQNFLVSKHVLEKIAETAELTREDTVLEIGPGIGTMTQYLAERAKKVIAVEIDQALLPILADTLSDYANVTVIHADILKLDLTALSKERNEGRPFKIVANLPYYITTPIILKLLESHAPFESITVMVQKEVADRMQARPGGKDYGALSLAVQYYAKPEVTLHVTPSCFIPRPSVDSSVIRLIRYERAPIPGVDEKKLFSVIRASFGQRRKTLANSLANASDLSLTKERVQSALEGFGWSLSIRGEALTLEEFEALCAVLFSKS